MLYFWKSKYTTIGSISIMYQSIFLRQLIQWSNQFTNKKIVCIVWQWYNHAFSEFKRIWHIWGFYVLFLENQLYTYWNYFQNVSIYVSEVSDIIIQSIFQRKKVLYIVWWCSARVLLEFKRVWHIWCFYVLFLEYQLYTYWEYLQNVSINFLRQMIH